MYGRVAEDCGSKQGDDVSPSNARLAPGVLTATTGNPRNPTEVSDWPADRIAGLRCVVRPDGRKSHVFLDHGNICQCGDVDLNAYRRMELR